ncbi:pentatricopeptide repeat-containing protein At4g31070, mitochondrial-like [Cornus florida]|uniref:pentatricopeptide repeat-containing protein At4g31070, mitochondrial-like n=1 Tax=Cornus florida TaxID=4283 RepID=UPI00289D0C08|nr:pentatricopeptide repeat-containing protein At4g31070, mitochondrial-like [Cornus florida]
MRCIVLKTGSDLDPTIPNSVISMHAKFSDIECARKMFDTMPHKDSISWNSMINCYVQNGYFVDSLNMFKEMYVLGFIPKPELIASILSVCARTRQLRLGREIHAVLVVDERIEDSVFLWTALVGLYMKCNDSLMAFCVFDRMESKNEVSWTSMVSGCAANHNYDIALDCFRAMQLEGIKPNRVTLIAVLPACAELGSIKHGREIHGYAFRHGFDSEFLFSSALIHMYCKCREALRPAKLIFERSTVKDVVMWSSIIASYSQTRDTAEEAIKHFHQMQMEGIQPNSVTLLAVLSACTNLASVNHGRAVHGYILKSSFSYETFIANSLINMYLKCGCLMDSHQIFKEMYVKDPISWSGLINAHALHGYGEEALQLFLEMQELGLEPDAITYLAILSACNHAGLVEEGQKLFAEAVKDDKILLTTEHYACYIDLLGKAGKLEDAYEIVTTMSIKPSTRIWSSLISACKIHGRLEVAEMLAHRLIKLDPENAANYMLLSMVYAESGNWFGVEEVRREMTVRGLRKSYGFSKIELENDNW